MGLVEADPDEEEENERKMRRRKKKFEVSDDFVEQTDINQ